MKTYTRTFSILVVIFIFISSVAFSNTGDPLKKFRNKKYNHRNCNICLFRNIETNFLTTGSLHGGNLVIGMNFGTTKNTINLKGLFENSNKKFEGIGLEYRRYVIPSYKAANFYLYSSGIYRLNTKLCDGVNKICHPSSVNEFEYESFNTFEMYAGFGFGFNVFKGFYTSFSIGFGGYYSEICSGYDLRCKQFKSIRQDSDMALSIEFGISYSF